VEKSIILEAVDEWYMAQNPWLIFQLKLNWDMEYRILRTNGSPKKKKGSESIIQLVLSYFQQEDKWNSQNWQTQIKHDFDYADGQYSSKDVPENKPTCE